MHFNVLALAAIASVAVAQTATTSAASSGYTCAAQNIVEACKSTINAQIASCEGNDWDCLCTQYTNLSTCYNNCPGDPVASSVQQQVSQYCAAASAYGTKAVAASSTAGATSHATSAAAATTTSGSQTSASATPTHNAAAGVPVGGSLAVIILAALGVIA